MTKLKNTSSALSLSGLHYLRQRKVVIIIGAIIFAAGFFAAITFGTIVINETANNKLTPQGYPETQIFGISVYSFEYGSAFTAVLGMFILFGGLIGMDSKKNKQ